MEESPMSEQAALGRRTALKGILIGGAATLGAAALAACTPDKSRPATSPTAGASSRDYEKAVETTSDARAAFASPHLSNAGVYFVQAKNWLDAMEKSYGADPKSIRLVMVNYGPMNFITYNDRVWNTYKAGAWQGVTDPTTKADAVRNPFADDVKKLQDRGCVFYT